MNSLFLFIPFILQTVCMAIDELFYHQKRGLPRWERIGHPLDTLTVIICYLWLYFAPGISGSLIIYTGLSIFSCLFVTKDEFVHYKYCDAGENWLHALLFILHPLTLICSGLLWPINPTALQTYIYYYGFEAILLPFVILVIIIVGLYQLIYWNCIWKPKPNQQRSLSITTYTIN